MSFFLQGDQAFSKLTGSYRDPLLLAAPQQPLTTTLDTKDAHIKASSFLMLLKVTEGAEFGLRRT